jgi:hypothetical protein
MNVHTIAERLTHLIAWLTERLTKWAPRLALWHPSTRTLVRRIVGGFIAYHFLQSLGLYWAFLVDVGSLSVLRGIRGYGARHIEEFDGVKGFAFFYCLYGTARALFIAGDALWQCTFRALGGGGGFAASPVVAGGTATRGSSRGGDNSSGNGRGDRGGTVDERGAHPGGYHSVRASSCFFLLSGMAAAMLVMRGLWWSASDSPRGGHHTSTAGAPSPDETHIRAPLMIVFLIVAHQLLFLLRLEAQNWATVVCHGGGVVWRGASAAALLVGTLLWAAHEAIATARLLIPTSGNIGSSQTDDGYGDELGMWGSVGYPGGDLLGVLWLLWFGAMSSGLREKRQAYAHAHAHAHAHAPAHVDAAQGEGAHRRGRIGVAEVDEIVETTKEREDEWEDCDGGSGGSGGSGGGDGGANAVNAVFGAGITAILGLGLSFVVRCTLRGWEVKKEQKRPPT